MIHSLLKKFKEKATTPIADNKPEKIVCESYDQALVACQNLGHLPITLKPLKARNGYKGSFFKCTTYEELRDNFKTAIRGSSEQQVWVSKPN